MIVRDPNSRRRRAGAIAAICGGTAASTAALGRHAASHGTDGVVWQDAGLAAAMALIVVALVVMVVAARRR